MKNVLILALIILAIGQTKVVLDLEKGLDVLDGTLTSVVFRCTGAYIPTIEEKNNARIP